MAGKRDTKSKKPAKPAADTARQLFAALAPGPCSFCGRTPDVHEGLQFQRGDYRICAECVGRMHRELKQDPKP